MSALIGLKSASRCAPRRIELLLLSLLYLHKIELDRSCAAENRDENTDFALLRLDFLDGAVEVLERAVDDLDRLADFEQYFRFRAQRALFHLLLDFRHFGHRHFGRV